MLLIPLSQGCKQCKELHRAELREVADGTLSVLLYCCCCRAPLLLLLLAAGGCTCRASLLPTSGSSCVGAAARRALVMWWCRHAAGPTWRHTTGHCELSDTGECLYRCVCIGFSGKLLVSVCGGVLVATPAAECMQKVHSSS
jgi:hypothetical protein